MNLGSSSKHRRPYVTWDMNLPVTCGILIMSSCLTVFLMGWAQRQGGICVCANRDLTGKREFQCPLWKTGFSTHINQANSEQGWLLVIGTVKVIIQNDIEMRIKKPLPVQLRTPFIVCAALYKLQNRWHFSPTIAHGDTIDVANYNLRRRIFGAMVT